MDKNKLMSDFSHVEDIIQQGLKNTAPAIALAVYYKDELVVERAYGYIEPSHPLHHQHLFDLASVTKLYTTTAFLMQTAENIITLDDPVVNIIPEFGTYGLRPIEGGQNPHTLAREPADSDTSQQVDPSQICFRHLLTHTSGLAPWWDLFNRVGPIPLPPGKPDPLPRDQRIANALDIIAKSPFVDVPNHRVRYSDLGLILLGEAVARLDGVSSLDISISRRILAPFELDHTLFNPQHMKLCVPTELDARWRKRRCRGEVHDENACALGGIAGHAGLFGTPRDVAAFGLLWLRALQNHPNQLLLPPTIAKEAVHEQTQGEYRGLGWVLKSPEGSSCGQYFDASSFGHTGFTGTSLWIDPQRNLVIALLTNRVFHGRDADAITTFRPKIHDAVAQWVDAL